jgi:hypothetical protein
MRAWAAARLGAPIDGRFRRFDISTDEKAGNPR